MDLSPYVEEIRQQVAVAADAAGDDARVLADRLMAPLDAAVRLSLQGALAAAAEEITCDLAPGSVELRLRGRDLEFVVAPPPPDEPDRGDDPDDADEGVSGRRRGRGAGSTRPTAWTATWRGSTCAWSTTSRRGSSGRRPPRACR